MDMEILQTVDLQFMVLERQVVLELDIAVL